jgi:hypothetical protein
LSRGLAAVRILTGSDATEAAISTAHLPPRVLPASRFSGIETSFVIGGAVLLALLVRALLLSRDLVYIDRGFIPDDTYYTLAIARHLALGGGPTADGVIPTSGFQPLIAFLLLPVFWLTANSDAPVYAAVILSGLVGSLSVGIAGLIVQRATRSAAATLAATILLATCPVVVSNDLNGLETSLATFLALGSLLAAAKLQESPTTRQAVLLGLCVGAAILARVDNCVVALLLGLGLLARVRIGRLALVVAVAGLVVLPWWGYCAWAFGSVLPESGAAVKQLTLIDQRAGTGVGVALVEAMKSVAAILGIADPVFVLSAFVALAGIVLFTLSVEIRNRRIDALLLLGATSVLLFLFYLLYLPAFWYFDRYFNLIYVCLILCAVVSAARHLGSLRLLAGGVAAVVVACNLANLAPLLRDRADSLASGDDTRHGYAEVARRLIGALPAGARLAALQSGALSYYADYDGRNVRIVNLDGVVSRPAYAALKRGDLAHYMSASEVGYFADWDSNLRTLARYAGPGGEDMALTRIADMKPQGNRCFRLYAIRFDAAPVPADAALDTLASPEPRPCNEAP